MTFAGGQSGDEDADDTDAFGDDDIAVL